MDITRFFLASNQEYQWFAVISGSDLRRGKGVTIDGSGNVIATGISGSSLTSPDAYTVKYDYSGALQWQRRLKKPTSGTNFGEAVGADNDGNVYIAGSSYDPNNFREGTLIAKYNSSGTLQWQRLLSSTSDGKAYELAVDRSSGDVYAVGGGNAGTGTGCLIVKYNTSGTQQWNRAFYGSSSSIAGAGRRITLDSSNNVYVCGDFNETSGSNRNLVVAKYNSSGTLQSQFYYGATASLTARGIGVDASGNIYVACSDIDYPFLLAKFNSSGTVQWQKRSSSNLMDVRGLAVDSNGYIYVAGDTYTGAQYMAGIAKFDPNGDVVWQRGFGMVAYGATDFRLYVENLFIDTRGNVCVTGYKTDASFSYRDLFILKVTGDGSGIGTYGTSSEFSYEAVSSSYATPTYSSGSYTVTEGSPTRTSYTTTYTDETPTYTSTVTQI